MKSSHFLLGFALMAGLAGCASTPQDRIEKDPNFKDLPSEAQTKILAGDVAIGFTEEEVLLARGQPDFKSMRQTPTGQDEDWFYGDHRARIGFGVGVGSVDRSSAVGGSASVGGIPIGTSRVLRVTFQNGVVVAYEGPGPS